MAMTKVENESNYFDRKCDLTKKRKKKKKKINL